MSRDKTKLIATFFLRNEPDELDDLYFYGAISQSHFPDGFGEVMYMASEQYYGHRILEKYCDSNNLSYISTEDLMGVKGDELDVLARMINRCDLVLALSKEKSCDLGATSLYILSLAEIASRPVISNRLDMCLRLEDRFWKELYV